MPKGAPWTLAALLAGALLLAGPARQALAQAPPLRVGVILPLTGGSAPYGEMALNGVRLAQEQEPQVLGRGVELVVADSKSDKVEATNAANRLIQKDKVVAILGPLSSSETLAAGSVAEAAGVPMITAWATNPVVTQGKRYVFRTCFIDPFQGGVAARFARDRLKAQTAAVLVDVGRDYSLGLAGFFGRTFSQDGGKVLLQTQYSEGDQEFAPQLLAIKAKNPDVVYLPGYLPEEPLILRQARELGLKQPFISGDAAQSQETLDIGGKAVEGLYFTTHFSDEGSNTPAGVRFRQAYRARFGLVSDAMAALGYDAYGILAAALARAGEGGLKLAQALEATQDYPGACGSTSMVGHDAVKPAYILTVRQGKYAFVTTVNP